MFILYFRKLLHFIFLQNGQAEETVFDDFRVMDGLSSKPGKVLLKI